MAGLRSGGRRRGPRSDCRARPRPRTGLPPLAAAAAQPLTDPPARSRAAGGACRSRGRAGPGRPRGRRPGPPVEFRLLPEWTRAWHHRNIFTEPGAIAAQAELLRTLGRALAGRPNLLGLQLGNELNNLVRDNPATPQQIDSYLDTLLAATREGLPRIPASCWPCTPRTMPPGTATTTRSPPRPQPARAI